MSATARLQELGISLPPAPKPAGVYQPVLLVDHIAYVSGHGPLNNDGSLTTGRIGDDLDTQAGYAAARQTGLAILASLQTKLGSIDRVKRLVKLFGMVQCTPDFTQQPAVINGCSELFRDVFGPENGVGARSAVGISALPMGMAVEIEAIFEVE